MPGIDPLVKSEETATPTHEPCVKMRKLSLTQSPTAMHVKALTNAQEPKYCCQWGTKSRPTNSIVVDLNSIAFIKHTMFPWDKDYGIKNSKWQ